jgi:hypothetical protein
MTMIYSYFFLFFVFGSSSSFFWTRGGGGGGGGGSAHVVEANAFVETPIITPTRRRRDTTSTTHTHHHIILHNTNRGTKDSTRLHLFNSWRNNAKETSPTASTAKDELLSLLSQVTRNQATSTTLTQHILSQVSKLEPQCPTKNDDVLNELNGNWELIWTAQDYIVNNSSSNNKKDEHGMNVFRKRVQRWVNPLENQAYSNKPIISFDDDGDNDDDEEEEEKSQSRPIRSGRSNPILPQSIQNKLEDIGVLSTNAFDDDDDDDDDQDNEETKDAKYNNDTNRSSLSSSSIANSSQAIDGSKGRVRNVVSVSINNPLRVPPLLLSLFNTNLIQKKKTKKKIRGFLTVDLDFKVDNEDERKINVKFDEFRIVLQNSPLDVQFPLGPFGPTGK